AETAAVLQCAGNGRRWMAGEPEGTPWGTGASGCARWGGVRVADLVKLLGGLAAGARYCTAAGAEPVTDPVDRMERSVPVDKALRDALLAVDMNGEPLSLAHGGPLRLIVPGWYAVNSVKYVARLAFTTAESDAAISTIRYRVSPMGAAPSPQHQTCGPMNPKSWLLEPAGHERITPGAVTARGLALGGEHPLSGVEVTADGGQTWQPGRLEPPDLGPFAWRVFTAELELGPGRHVVATRAADASGRRQPRHSEPNDQGYRANGWQELAVTLEVVAG
ncbi:MAG: molybdopterin-dependent oxidoreductase, partial [Euzebyales bacterium]|nr:molybdopterin-dependent oxidoreductase [Euzebyales bacterium]